MQNSSKGINNKIRAEAQVALETAWGDLSQQEANLRLLFQSEVGTKLVAYLKAFANYNTTVISTCVPTNIVTDPKFAASVAEMLAVSSQYRFLANLPDELKEWLEAQEETKKAAEQHASVRAINAARES